MAEYGVSDYGVFNDAISVINSLVDGVNSINDIINECKSSLNDGVFQGPIADNCKEVFGTLATDVSAIISDLTTMSGYLDETSANYQMGDTNASNTVTNADDISTTPMSSTNVSYSSSPSSSDSTATTPSSSYTYSGSVDISKYNSNSSTGFNVTSGNTTYNLSDSDRDLICAIVSAESDQSYDDALAVTSVILNRCEAPNWVSSHGTNPVSQATAPNQFVVYQSGSYKKYTNGNAPDTVQQAVDDALNGVRNNEYLSFRSNSSTGYSSNMITSTGNRYK